MDEYQTQHFWKMIEQKKYTYRELKEVLNSLNDEQLNGEVMWAGDGRGGKIGGAWIVEDQINPSGDGMEPVSAYDNDPVRKEP
jgi:hypothetical protein